MAVFGLHGLYLTLQSFDSFLMDGNLPMQDRVLPFQCLDLITTEKKQVPHKFVGLVGHLGIHKGVYLVFRDITPVHAFGRVDISCKGIERQTTVIPRYRNNVLQHNHVAPHGIGAAFLHSAQEILEVVDEREVQLFEGNILTPVGMGQELPNMFADGYVPLECPFGSAVSDFLCKLGIVLLKEFQQGFLLDTDTEIGIFQLGGCNISVRLHQFLVAAVHLHPNLVNRTAEHMEESKRISEKKQQPKGFLHHVKCNVLSERIKSLWHKIPDGWHKNSYAWTGIVVTLVFLTLFAVSWVQWHGYRKENIRLRTVADKHKVTATILKELYPELAATIGTFEELAAKVGADSTLAVFRRQVKRVRKEDNKQDKSKQ